MEDAPRTADCMADLIARHDWASTPLGKMEVWPPCLRTAVDLMLATPQPVYIGWGADLVSLYNDGYIPILGSKHPVVLGKPYRETWPEIWDEFRPVAEAVMAGEARYFEDLPVALTGRPGRPMSWFTFSWTPLRGSNGRVGGFYCVAVETSGQVLARQESKRFRRLFQASPAPFLILKPDTRFTIIEVNDAYLAATMRTRDEVIGRGLFEAFPDNPDDPTANGVGNLRASLERALASRRLEVMPVQKYDVARPDGTFEERWWSPTNSPVLGENGEVEAIIHNVSDVTGQYRAEAAARQSAAQLKLAIEVGEIGHWSLDLATNTLTTSATCRRNFGRPADEPLPYEALVASIHPDDRDRQQHAVHAAIGARSSFDIEYRLITPEGETRWLAVRGRYEDDEHPRLVGVSLNITERKRAEQAMRESEARQAFLLKFSDALRAETGIEAMGNRAVAMLAEHLRLDRCWISKVFEDQGVSTVGPERIRPDLPPMAGIYQLSDYPESMRQLMVERMFVEDAAGDTRFADSEKELFAGLNLRALLVVPLRKGERRVVWALAAAMAEPRQWTDGERALLEDVAERTWTAVERARIDEALRASEAKYRTLIESIDEGFVVQEMVRDEADRAVDLRMLEVNPAFTRQTGLGQDTVGKLNSEFLANLEKSWLDTYDRVARTGIPERVEDYNQATDRWYAVHFSRIAGEDHQVAAVFEDVTDRHRAEAALKASEARQTFLLKLSDALREETEPRAIALRSVTLLAGHMRLDRAYVAVVDKAGDRAEIGPEYRRAGMLPVEGVLTLSDFPDAFAQVQAHTLVLEDTASDPSLSDLDRRSFAQLDMGALIVASARKGARNPVWALLVAMATPRQWTSGELALVEEVAERTWAMVERARAEKALLENQRRLEDASRTKDRFLAMLGHELRNPLAPIVTTLQLMKLRAPETLKHEREIIASQTHALVDMVDDLLDVARIARGDLKLEKRALYLADIVTEAAATTAWAMGRYGQTLHTNMEAGLVVLGDRRRLVQVVVNLLVNAAKYSPPDRNIDIDVARDADAGVIRVRDQGIGMSLELQARVFEAFIQAEQSLDRRRSGLGLGLAIVRNIVELHGGSVAVASDGTDKGSEFTVCLPLLHDVDGGSPEHAAEAESPPPSAGAPARVLLVDDHVAGAQTMGALLEAVGYKVHIEHDGPAALAAAKADAPAIALLDIGLPGMDGYELARAFRAMPEFSKLPLVALTGYGQAEDRERARAAGFDEHVTKPVGSDDLVPLIEKLVHAS